jgi:hypothetical protein
MDAISKSNGSLIDMVSYECTVSHGLENYISAMRRGNNLNIHSNRNSHHVGGDLNDNFNHHRISPPAVGGGVGMSLYSPAGNMIGSSPMFTTSSAVQAGPAAVPRPSPHVFNFATNEGRDRTLIHGIMPPASASTRRTVQHQQQQFPIPVRYSSSSLDRDPHHYQQFSHVSNRDVYRIQGEDPLFYQHQASSVDYFSLPIAAGHGGDAGWNHSLSSLVDEKKYSPRDLSSSVGSTSPFDFGIDHSPPLSSSSSSISNPFSLTASSLCSTSTSAASLNEELKCVF